jgi:hypothetical protein
MDNFFIFHENSWGPFIRIGSGQIAFIIGLYAILEKFRNGDLLMLSLPVSRSHILLSRYATSVLIGIAGIIVLFVNAHILDMISEDVPRDLQQFSGPMVFLFIIFFLIVFISLYIPVVVRIDRIWAIGIFGYIIAALFILGMRYSVITEGLFSGGFRLDNMFFALILMMIMILTLYLSLSLSKKLFKNKDL